MTFGPSIRRFLAMGWLAVDIKSGTKCLMFYAERDIENRHNECRFFFGPERESVPTFLNTRRNSCFMMVQYNRCYEHTWLGLVIIYGVYVTLKSKCPCLAFDRAFRNLLVPRISPNDLSKNLSPCPQRRLHF
jgi:hypothetical protein